GSDFNYDFHVTLDESVTPVEYNFRTPAEYAAAGKERPLPGEYPGTSFFLRQDDRVFHTYSSFARGAEMTGGSYYFLDLTALGRQEDWEEPKGRSASAREGRPDFAPLTAGPPVSSGPPTPWSRTPSRRADAGGRRRS